MRAVIRASFQRHGLLALRDGRGQPRFNLTQRRWRHANVPMDWDTELTRAVQNLAFDILARFMTCERCIDSLTGEFASDFLLTIPQEGGRIPREVILEWLSDRTRGPGRHAHARKIPR